jgi:carbon-monoxide dehydrogenase large subunit
MPASAIGAPTPRVDGMAKVTGGARYAAEVAPDGLTHAVLVQSTVPAGRITRMNADLAERMPGVVAVLTHENAPRLARATRFPRGGALQGLTPLQDGRVRFDGQPVAVVVAETAALAADAAEVVAVVYDPLPSVTDAEAAVADGAPLLWPDFGTNVSHAFGRDDAEDPLEGADVVVRARLVNQRVAPVPMEPNGIAVVPDDDGVTIWVSSQVPFDVRDDLADTLGAPRDRVRVIAPDVGGGFGSKGQVYAEYHVVAAVTALLGRPVRWTETRSESMLSLTHGRAQIQTVELGARRDGTLVGLRADILADMGAYPVGAFMPGTTQSMLSGVYRIPRVVSSGRSVVTNTTPIGAYRGAGRPEAAALIERAMDLLADELDIDPAELRRRNFIPPDAFPFTTAAGAIYDSGDYAKTLDEALRIADHDALREEQAERRHRDDPICLGIGISTYVEITAFSGREYASVEVGSDGRATAFVGTSSHGQGHETAFAQLVSASLGIPFDDVQVVHSDTRLVARGEGTWGSRSLQIGGSSLYEQAEAVVEQGRNVAAALLEVDAEDVERVEGGIAVVGAPARAVGWAEVAGASDGGALRAEGRWRQRGSTFPFGAHVAVVEVDTATGAVHLRRMVAVDDCGRILNPMLVRGQQHGGLAQGIAQALFEEVRYDDDANPVTSTLATYAMPSAADLPRLETANTITPTELNPLGAKGIGEAATIGSTPAVQNAVIDAVSHLGVRHIDLPLTAERVWRALEDAGAWRGVGGGR